MGGVEAEAVVKEVRSTYASGKTRSYEWRASQLKALQKMVTLHNDEIIEALRSDLKKPEFEAVVHEISVVRASCKLALKELHRWMKPQKVKTTLITFPSSAKIVSEPYGVVLVISAWNFPFSLSLDPMIGAIAAGNAVVLKPSEIASATSSLLARLLGEYMDTSAVKVVEGGVSETTALLNQKWDKILYTGGSTVGRIVLMAAAKHLTPVVLELGGKCPLVLDSKVNLKVAVRRIIAGKWGCNSGQACISPDYVITTKEFAKEVVNVLSAEIDKFFGKDPLQSKELSSIINGHHFSRLSKLLDDEEVSCKIVHGGQRDAANLKIAPTIALDVSRDSLVMSEEIFGPILPIITVDKIEECFGVINSAANSKPLAAYLFTNDKKLEKKFVQNVAAGGMIINDTVLHFLEPGLPFGGIGESGMGAYHGKFSFDAFSHKKPLLKRSFAIDIPARYPPYTAGKQRFLKAVLEGDFVGILASLATCWLDVNYSSTLSKKIKLK